MVTRREFIKLIYGIFLGAVTQPYMEKLGLLTRQFNHMLQEQLNASQRRKRTLFEDIFGSFENFGTISIGREHPDLQEPFARLHPDNEEAASTIFNLLKRNEVEVKDRIFDLYPNSSELGYNILSIGSAKSTLTTRLLERYSGNDGRYLVRDSLPYLKWELLIDERKLFGISTRYLEKKKWIRPNHALIDNERHNEYAPLLDTNGWLREDLLLISKLPNNINADAIHMKSNCIIVEGVHGTGTKALGLLIHSGDMLSELKKRVRDNKYWQALYRIAVKHDHNR
jgi:hypothetical protein